MKTLADEIAKNRENLKKQEAWASGVAKSSFMSDIVIEEKKYGDGERERIDIIYKQSLLKEKKPVLFYIHGGGWIAGNKEARRIYCGKYADVGYAVINIEYELAPEAVFPTAIGQCVKAVDYAYSIADKYHMDMSRIVVGGESAGVYYAMFLCEIAKDKTMLKKLNLPEMQHTEFDVRVAIFNCAAVDFKKMGEKGFPGDDLMFRAYLGCGKKEVLSGHKDKEIEIQLPLNYMTADFPPTFLIYGSLDSLRFNTFMIDAKMNELGISHKIYKSRGIFYGQHTTTMILKDKKAFKTFEIVNEYVRAFLD